MAGVQLRVAYQLDRAALSAADADWLAALPKAPAREREDALRRLRADAASVDGDRDRLHLVGMGLAVLGRPEEAAGVFVRASELEPSTGVDAVNAAVALVHVGDLERARLWLAPVAQGDDEMAAVARQFIEEIDWAERIRRRRRPRALEPGTEPDVETTGQLLREVSRGGPAGHAALNSLRLLVQRDPANEYFRETLMFGLMANANLAEALTQAEMLEARPDPTHERHFNIAQAFWFCGDRQRAHEHFQRAYDLAGTDEERQDVVSMLEYLREQAEPVDED